MITLHYGRWGGKIVDTEMENIKACREHESRGGWRTRHAKSQGKSCQAKTWTECAKCLRWERLWSLYGNEKKMVSWWTQFQVFLTTRSHRPWRTGHWGFEGQERPWSEQWLSKGCWSPPHINDLILQKRIISNIISPTPSLSC